MGGDIGGGDLFLIRPHFQYLVQKPRSKNLAPKTSLQKPRLKTTSKNPDHFCHRYRLDCKPRYLSCHVRAEPDHSVFRHMEVIAPERTLAGPFKNCGVNPPSRLLVLLASRAAGPAHI
jgi:hypothetical protein